MIIRNPNATCGNCPFWMPLGKKQGKDGKEQEFGECRVKIPDLAIYPQQTEGPSVATPHAVPRMAWQIDRMVFTPPSTYWCGQHPFFFAEVTDQGSAQ